jgi:branched-chain amino acid transport system substrate-binding protein
MNNDIFIGNVGTTSGPLGKRYGVMQHAVKAWAEEVNKHGGLAGRLVRVEVGDDANDPARHLGLVQHMVEQKHVVAFAGMPAATTQRASVAYLEEQGVPVVGGSLGNAVWGTSPILFPQGIAAQRKGRMLMRAAATSGKTRYAFIGQPELSRDATLKALRSAAEEVGIEVALTSEIQAGAPDATEVCLAAKRAGIELMTIAAEFPTQVQVIESCTRQQFNPIYVTTGTTTDQELLDLVGEQMEGAIGLSRTAPWMAEEPADLVVYREAMQAHGLKIGAASLDGWVSGRILEQALRRIDAPATPQAVAEALRGLGGEDLDGLVAPLGFSSSATSPNPGASCFWLLVARHGTWVPAEAGRLYLPERPSATSEKSSMKGHT